VPRRRSLIEAGSYASRIVNSARLKGEALFVSPIVVAFLNQGRVLLGGGAGPWPLSSHTMLVPPTHPAGAFRRARDHARMIIADRRYSALIDDLEVT
jgi:hypothetical protein